MNFEEASRQSQKAFEPFAAMIYFAPEALQRHKTLGLKGRQSYFCGRAAPMGAVPGQVVAATFYNFNPVFVIEQVNTGWQIANPADVMREKLLAVEEAGQRLLAPKEGEEDLLPNIEKALPLVKKATADLRPDGRALFAAHQALPWPDEPLTALWFGLSLLREYRGDGHIAALMVEGVSGLESILLQVAYSPRLPLAFLMKSRAWDESSLEVSQAHLAQRGLLSDGALTPQGKEVRERIEQHTDRMDAAPFEALGEADTLQLLSLIAPLSRRIVDHGGLDLAARRD